MHQMEADPNGIKEEKEAFFPGQISSNKEKRLVFSMLQCPGLGSEETKLPHSTVSLKTFTGCVKRNPKAALRQLKSVVPNEG